MDVLIAFLTTLASFVPVVASAAPLIAYLVDAFKRLGLPDGFAPLASGLLNAVVWALLFFASDSQKDLLNGLFPAILAVAPFIVGLIGSLLAAPLFHDLLTVRGFGYKQSMRRGG